MQVTSASAVTGGISSPDSLTTSAQTLNQNDFLKLLVAQMQNQNPLEPQSNTEMAAQMAQFTSLTQASAMSASLAMIQANSLIGTTVTGPVQGVVMQNGTPEILVNGATYTLNQVTSVAPTVTSPTAGTAAN
jgi:flagellar basal-body rod modification protein FlgD